MPADEAAQAVTALEQRLRGARETEALAQRLAQARQQVRQAYYYEQARQFAHNVSSRFQRADKREFVVITGGGGGVMEAANRGAHEAGARSIGLNITLPREQLPNPYITPELAFRFRYFGLRKLHFLLRARALVAFPGGFGTLDEVFEVLTLLQTGTVARIRWCSWAVSSGPRW
ncbi:MAG: LOG family protein [Burkholderiaceae bacterium]